MATPGLSRYKVLGAALALDEFTVADVRRYSGVERDTIHKKIISRDRDGHFFETVDKAASEGRGRPQQRYRVAPDKVGDLQSLFGQLHDEFRQMAVPALAQHAKTKAPSARLLAAEHALLEEYPKADRLDVKEAIIRRAQADRDRDAEQPGTPEAGSRRKMVDALLEFSEVELQVERGATPGPVEPVSGKKVMDSISEMVRAAAELGNDFAIEIRTWLETSPLAKRTLYVPEKEDGLPKNVIIGDPIWAQVRREPVTLRLGRHEFLKELDLVSIEDSLDDIRAITERLYATLRANHPSVLVKRWSGPDQRPLLETDREALCLLTCDSTATGEKALRWARQARQRSRQVFVVDADSHSEFMRDVLVSGAQYVPHARNLDAPTLVQAIPALAILADG